MQDTKSGTLDASWMAHLEEEFNEPYMKTLKAFLRDEKKAGKVIYPPGSQIFNAFNATPFDQVRIVIIGQDPYHGPNQAHGLSFSVPEGVPAPPSLRNIFKEIDQEFGTQWSGQGNLEQWTKQGVLLLNAVLTVEQSQAGAHQGKGWENFTDKAIAVLNEHRENLVFLLWGAYAKKKGQYIDTDRHLVLHSAHPSPLSAHRGFMGNGHFRKANDYLIACQQNPIDWSL